MIQFLAGAVLAVEKQLFSDDRRNPLSDGLLEHAADLGGGEVKGVPCADLGGARCRVQ